MQEGKVFGFGVCLAHLGPSLKYFLFAVTRLTHSKCYIFLYSDLRHFFFIFNVFSEKQLIPTYICTYPNWKIMSQGDSKQNMFKDGLSHMLNVSFCDRSLSVVSKLSLNHVS